MLKQVAVAVALFAAAGTVDASCTTDGITSQSVYLSVDGKSVERWTPEGAGIHRVKLPQGYELGLRVEPATPEKYRESFERTKAPAMPELVKIELFDMSTIPPTILSTTWGGSNSKQGFGPRGGANGVPVIRDQIELFLHKPVCVTPDKVADVH